MQHKNPFVAKSFVVDVLWLMTIQNVHSVRSTPPNDADREHVKQYRKRVGEHDDAIACLGNWDCHKILVGLLSSLHVHLVNLEVSRRCVIWLASTAKVVMVWNGMRKELSNYAVQGNIQPRYYNLGSNEGRKGNNVRAKHFAIAARSGDDDALTLVREEFQVEL